MKAELECEQIRKVSWAGEQHRRNFVEHVALGDLTARKRAERLTRALQALTAVNQTLIRATEEQTLLSEVCRIIGEVGGYRMAWVGYKNDDPDQTLRPMAWWGHEDGYLNRVKISWGDNEFGQGPASQAIRTGRPEVLRNTQTDIRIAQWQEAATQRGYASILGAPLLAEGRPFGSLTIYSAKTDAGGSSQQIRLSWRVGNEGARPSVRRQRFHSQRTGQGNDSGGENTFRWQFEEIMKTKYQNSNHEFQ